MIKILHEFSTSDGSFGFYKGGGSAGVYDCSNVLKFYNILPKNIKLS
jgi:hypothetical protein